MKFQLVFGTIAALTWAGCSSEGDIVPKKERFARTTFDAGNTDPDGKKPRDPNANCVKPGTPNNERGVGGYCEQSSECAYDGGPRFCTADFNKLSSIADDQWFCSTLCQDDSDCGSGAVCAMSKDGKGCTPLTCRTDASN